MSLIKWLIVISYHWKFLQKKRKNFDQQSRVKQERNLEMMQTEQLNENFSNSNSWTTFSWPQWIDSELSFVCFVLFSVGLNLGSESFKVFLTSSIDVKSKCVSFRSTVLLNLANFILLQNLVMNLFDDEAFSPDYRCMASSKLFSFPRAWRYRATRSSATHQLLTHCSVTSYGLLIAADDNVEKVENLINFNFIIAWVERTNGDDDARLQSN